MDLFTLLGPLDPDVTPDRCKLHLATWNGLHDPLDLYLQGVFDEWQSDQNRRNFSRCDFIVALIAMPEPDLWLFAGVTACLGRNPATVKTESTTGPAAPVSSTCILGIRMLLIRMAASTTSCSESNTGRRCCIPGGTGYNED